MSERPISEGKGEESVYAGNVRRAISVRGILDDAVFHKPQIG